MAEQKNFLDREYDKKNKENGGDRILPYSVALIPGLTALEQDALVKDVAERLVRDINKSSKVPEHIADRKLADRIEKYIQRMPEPIRDSWLLSATSETGVPKLLNEADSMYSYYEPETRNVSIKKSVFNEHPNVVVHEYEHKTNHDLNLEHPYYVNFSPSEVPDRMVGIDLGGKILSDFPSTIDGRRLDFVNPRTVKDVPAALMKEGYLKAIPSKNIKNKDAFKDAYEHSLFVGKFSNDILNLRPGSVTSQLDMIGKGGHNLDYRDDKYMENKKIGENLLNKGMTRDFTTPDGLRLGIEYNEMKDIAKRAALSTEGAAQIAEILATDGGEAYAKTKFPTSYESMMDEYRNDPRRSWPKEKLEPWRRYSHDSGDNVYASRGEPVKYNPNAELHYVRVPNAYGGYVYPDDYDKGTYAALKRGRIFIEYRGLDGKWYRVKPEEIKGASTRMKTIDELVKSVGKNLPKMIKRVK